VSLSKESDGLLRWHWDDSGKRVCDDCGAEVYVFDDGAICSSCKRQSEDV